MWLECPWITGNSDQKKNPIRNTPPNWSVTWFPLLHEEGPDWRFREFSDSLSLDSPLDSYQILKNGSFLQSAEIHYRDPNR